LYTYLVNVQVVPDMPVVGVSKRYYRSGPGNDGNGDKFANLGINGELGISKATWRILTI
jgi:hypothetical protein